MKVTLLTGQTQYRSYLYTMKYAGIPYKNGNTWFCYIHLANGKVCDQVSGTYAEVKAKITQVDL